MSFGFPRNGNPRDNRYRTASDLIRWLRKFKSRLPSLSPRPTGSDSARQSGKLYLDRSVHVPYKPIPDSPCRRSCARRSANPKRLRDGQAPGIGARGRCRLVPLVVCPEVIRRGAIHGNLYFDRTPGAGLRACGHRLDHHERGIVDRRSFVRRDEQLIEPERPTGERLRVGLAERSQDFSEGVEE